MYAIRSYYEIDKNLKNNCNINSEKKELLTPRELEIVRLVSQGFTNKEIGATMFISDRTVKCMPENRPEISWHRTFLQKNQHLSESGWLHCFQGCSM